MFMKRTLKVLIIGIIVFTLATVTYAFAAANTVPQSSAGDGQGAISGYTVSAIVYTLDATDLTKISKIVFTLTPAAGGTDATLVYVSVTGASPYTSCGVVGTAVTCTWGAGAGPTVVSATNLRVIATQ